MTTKVRKARAKKQVKQAIRKIDPADIKVILDVEEKEVEARLEAPKERVPGQTIDGMKVAWTRRDLEERFPIVELLSDETVKITWNGVVYQLLAGGTFYVPSVIREAYMNHRREQRTKASLPLDTGFETIVELGVGALPPE